MSDCLRTVLANRLTEKNKPHWGQARGSAIVHHPLFLPSIFLPLIFRLFFLFSAITEKSRIGSCG